MDLIGTGRGDLPQSFCISEISCIRHYVVVGHVIIFSNISVESQTCVGRFIILDDPIGVVPLIIILCLAGALVASPPISNLLQSLYPIEARATLSHVA